MVDLPRNLLQRARTRSILTRLALLLHRRLLRTRLHLRHENAEPAPTRPSRTLHSRDTQPGCLHLVNRDASAIQLQQPRQDRLGGRAVRTLVPAVLFRADDRSTLAVVHVLAALLFCN